MQKLKVQNSKLLAMLLLVWRYFLEVLIVIAVIPLYLNLVFCMLLVYLWAYPNREKN